MSARYLIRAPYQGRMVPRPHLPGSPYPSRKAAKSAAHRAGIEAPNIVTVRRGFYGNHP